MSNPSDLKSENEKISYFAIKQNKYPEMNGYGIPKGYHNRDKVIEDSRVVLYSTPKGKRTLNGYATVKSVTKEDYGTLVSWNGSYKKLSGTMSEVVWTKITKLPSYIRRDKIRVINKEIFEQIVKDGSKQEIDDLTERSKDPTETDKLERSPKFKHQITADPVTEWLNKGLSKKHIQILLKFAALQGEILVGKEPIKGQDGKGCDPDMFVNDVHIMHNLIRGIYVPKDDKFALSILLTEKKTNYGNEILYTSPLSWKIIYKPPTDSHARHDIATLKRCHENQIPLGILKNLKKSSNEVLGLGMI